MARVDDLMGYNGQIEAFRDEEYPMLRDNVYLDHAGTTLYSRSLVDRFARDMTTTLLGNPHAASLSSQTASNLVEDVRVRALQFFGADPAEFDLVFVANATAGIKLVAEALRAQQPHGFRYAYHQCCHTSLVGVREEARQSVCLTTEQVEAWADWGEAPEFPGLSHSSGSTDSPETLLFAYPAQSNMNGRRFPRSWSNRIRQGANSSPGTTTTAAASPYPSHPSPTTYTLLDAAALAATSPLCLDDPDKAADFTVVSFYKIFGFPDLGALIVRRAAEPVFDARRYFGGGTVDMVVCAAREQWHAPKSEGSLHGRLEDGTLPVHSILALQAAIDVHAQLFGLMAAVAQHTGVLARRLYQGLAGLKHGNGSSVCTIYSEDPGPGTSTSSTFGYASSFSSSSLPPPGPTIAFNLSNARGAWVSLLEFDKLANLKGFHVRTGGVCNPGGVAAALGLEPWEMRRNFSSGLRCGGDDDGGDDIVSGKPTGVIRVSLGAMSVLADVDRFVAFVKEFYQEETPPIPTLAPLPELSRPSRLPSTSSLVISSINVYPIKSCGAFHVPIGRRWEVRPEGLAWDREWCLVHRGTGRALSQKQFPQMVLVRPQLDFAEGVLRVSFAGKPGEICVPLSDNPAMFRAVPGGSSPTPAAAVGSAGAAATPKGRSRASRVCGEEIAAQVYTSETVNNFFTAALGIPCVLARFPPGGQGKSMRHAKAHLQRYQAAARRGAEAKKGDLPSPPESDSEKSNKSNKAAGETSAESEASELKEDNSSTEKTKDHSNVAEAAEAEENATTKGTTKEGPGRRILLSNESPILAIHMASLRALNRAIREQNSGAESDVPADVFRANIVIDSGGGGNGSDAEEAGDVAYSEDAWSRLRIGQQAFKMLGACRRCHMVCINQETGTKSDEPFVTLTKTRRFDGKVFFGTHMGHDGVVGGGAGTAGPTTRERQFPTIMVGEAVEAE